MTILRGPILARCCFIEYPHLYLRGFYWRYLFSVCSAQLGINLIHFKNLRERLKQQYKSSDGSTYGLHFGADLGAGFLWVHLFLISIRPEKSLIYTHHV